MKLKGIDGGPHKRRNMWFRGTLPGFELRAAAGEIPLSFGTPVKVLHGCRQLVP